ncbi:cytochrome P450 307a1-like [Euwallacea similis]|uniref:cytochrome P450 307a1-like n=1 Tax=Euwallacea similis TaxID=1736056 RepID=UPI00344EFC5A
MAVEVIAGLPLIDLKVKERVNAENGGGEVYEQDERKMMENEWPDNTVPHTTTITNRLSPSILTTMISFLTLGLIACILMVLVVTAIFNQKKQEVISADLPREPPSPAKLPLIGHLHLLGGYEVPYQAFTDLRNKFGDVVKLQLGSVKCVVVNEQKKIREVLVTRGHHFDCRPNFERYQRLFSGNKENSLAFCDWSTTQKTRRDMLKAYTFPRAFTNKFISLDNLISSTSQRLVYQIQNDGLSVELKPLLMRACADIFLTHFCSKSFTWVDSNFGKMVEDFDEVFYEVNQGYAADFLPFLLPLHQRKMQRMNALTHEIRNFVNTEVIKNKFETYDVDLEPSDYLESLIRYVKMQNNNDDQKHSSMDWETALFALEDIIGGHCAVGNFLTRLFAFLVHEPQVQQKIQKEIDTFIGSERAVSISDRNQLVYTEAVIYEAIRLISSPIVPRVANQTSSIGGYKIEKGTVLFLNNYHLNMSEQLWESPEKFVPERFIRQEKLFKPEHFLPFGGGRRSCMGYKLVQLISFGILAAVMQNFNLKPLECENYRIPGGSLAIKKKTFSFKLEQRSTEQQ